MELNAGLVGAIKEQLKDLKALLKDLKVLPKAIKDMLLCSTQVTGFRTNSHEGDGNLRF